MARKTKVEVWLTEEQIETLSKIDGNRSKAIRLGVERLITDYKNGELVVNEDNAKA